MFSINIMLKYCIYNLISSNQTYLNLILPILISRLVDSPITGKTLLRKIWGKKFPVDINNKSTKRKKHRNH